MDNQKIVDEIKRLRAGGIKNKELAGILGCSPGYISEVVSGKKKAGKDLNDSLESYLSAGGDNKSNVVVNGNSHHIDIHNISEPLEIYGSPATAMILDVIKGWDEKKRQRLAAKIVEMDGED